MVRGASVIYQTGCRLSSLFVVRGSCRHRAIAKFACLRNEYSDRITNYTGLINPQRERALEAQSLVTQRLIAHCQRWRVCRERCHRCSTRLCLVVGRRLPCTPAQQQVAQRLSEVSTCWYEDEEVTGVVRQRQRVEDVLHLAVVEVACPRDVSKHLTRTRQNLLTYVLKYSLTY